MKNDSLGTSIILFAARQIASVVIQLAIFASIVTAVEPCKKLYPIDSSNGRMGYIDSFGKEVVKSELEYALEFNDGVGTVKYSAGKFGTVDAKGHIKRFPGEFESVTTFSDGLSLAVIAEDDRNRAIYINKNGEEVFSIPFYQGLNYSEDFSDGILPVASDEGYKFYDVEGNLLFSIKDIDLPQGGFVEGIAIVVSEHGWGAINKDGKFIISPQQFSLYSMSDGLITMRARNEVRYIDRLGNTVLTLPFRAATEFHEGLAAFLSNKKWGFVDKKGIIVVAPVFDEVDFFSEGLAAAEMNKKIGFIDRKGEFVIEPKFDFVESPFDECGIAKVQVDGTTGYINRSGKWIWKNMN